LVQRGESTDNRTAGIGRDERAVDQVNGAARDAAVGHAEMRWISV